MHGRSKIRKILLISVTTFASFFHFPFTVYAWGPALTEIGNPTVGRACAGWTAVAEDAATAFMNPAGLLAKKSLNS